MQSKLLDRLFLERLSYPLKFVCDKDLCVFINQKVNEQSPEHIDLMTLIRILDPYEYKRILNCEPRIYKTS